MPVVYLFLLGHLPVPLLLVLVLPLALPHLTLLHPEVPEVLKSSPSHRHSRWLCCMLIQQLSVPLYPLLIQVRVMLLKLIKFWLVFVLQILNILLRFLLSLKFLLVIFLSSKGNWFKEILLMGAERLLIWENYRIDSFILLMGCLCFFWKVILLSCSLYLIIKLINTYLS